MDHNSQLCFDKETLKVGLPFKDNFCFYQRKILQSSNNKGINCYYQKKAQKDDNKIFETTSEAERRCKNNRWRERKEDRKKEREKVKISRRFYVLQRIFFNLVASSGLY